MSWVWVNVVGKQKYRNKAAGGDGKHFFGFFTWPQSMSTKSSLKLFLTQFSENTIIKFNNQTSSMTYHAAVFFFFKLAVIACSLFFGYFVEPWFGCGRHL